jgi:hypothetical protein
VYILPLYDIDNNEIVRNVIGHCSVTVRDIDGASLHF